MKVGQLDQARGKALEALALDEEFVEARILLAKVYIEQGHQTQAVKELTIVRQYAPQNAEVYFLLGVAHERSKQLDEALKCYRRAHALDNNHLDAIMAATEVLVVQKHLREAELYIESYLHLAGNQAGMYELAGRISMMQEKYEKAARYFQHACDLEPGNPRYREALGRAQFHAGLYMASLETLESLEEVEMEDYRVPVWALTMRGDCLMSLQRYRQARDAYHAASQRHPDDAGVWVNLAKVALALKDPPRAAVSARQALQQDAGRLEAKLLLGYALLQQDQPRQAAAEMHRVVHDHPDSALARCLLGRALAGMGRGDQAAEQYAAALKIDPDSALARELLSRSRTGGIAQGGKTEEPPR
jgi:tetratricopeptide (TPR) repeat protein